MAFFLDQKYLNLVSGRLPLFKKISDSPIYNCRCIICGDSTKNKRKKRGYFFKHKEHLQYKCHNCGVTLRFDNFLKVVDSGLYDEYIIETYKENNTKPRLADYPFEPVKFKAEEEKIFERIATSLMDLPVNHIAVQYCMDRLIPMNQFKRLFFIEHIRDVVQLNGDYSARITSDEPRLAIPYYTAEGKLVGVTCRSLTDSAQRYITVKLPGMDDGALVYGLEAVNRKKPIYVVEGPLDSLFLNNAIAISGTGIRKIESLDLDRENLIFVFDNQPRNKELCKVIDQCIEQDLRIVIWPQTIAQKDINEMVLNDIDVKKVIKENIYRGLSAHVKFNEWKRV